MKQIPITLLFVLSVTVLFGQDNLRLSLAEAQHYALEHNKTIQKAKLDVAASESKFKETLSQGLPQIDGKLDFTTYFGYEMGFDLNFSSDYSSLTTAQLTEASTQTLNTFSGIPALGVNGATYQDIYNYQAGSYYSGLLSGMLPKSTIKMTDASTATVQLGQLIFSGQYWTGLKVAKLGEKIAQQGLENSMLDIKESVTNSYLMVLVTQQSIETIKKSIENLKQVKGHTEMMFKTGMAEQTDADQISMQVTMLDNNLRSIERGLKMGNSMLKFQLGIEPEQNIELTENIETVLDQINPTQVNSNFDVDNNITYQLLTTQEEISAKMVDMQKMAYAPTITGYYAYNQKLKTTGFDMTPTNVAGLSMSVPIFSSGSRKSKVAQAKIELDKAQINKSIVKNQLELQEEQLQFDLNSAIENYEAQKNNVELAKRVYKTFENKFQQGMSSSLDLTNSNNNYLQAESNYIQAVLSLLQAKIAIDKLYNQL